MVQSSVCRGITTDAYAYIGQFIESDSLSPFSYSVIDLPSNGFAVMGLDVMSNRAIWEALMKQLIPNKQNKLNGFHLSELVGFLSILLCDFIIYFPAPESDIVYFYLNTFIW